MFSRNHPALVCTLVLGCGLASSTPPAAPVRHVLFIGNSLTAANDLPGMIQTLAASGGTPDLDVATVVRPNYSLEDHWNEGAAQQAIAAGSWDLVVLQQGPSALPASRTLLVEYTRRFDHLIRAAGARTGMYMVWPDASRLTAFDSVAASYAAAALAVHGDLFPAGAAWPEAWRLDPSAPLYGPDRFHPSVAGTYLVACVFYAALYHRSPVGLQAPAELPASLVATLQRAAGDVVAR